jgi:hypothetical protein
MRAVLSANLTEAAGKLRSPEAELDTKVWDELLGAVLYPSHRSPIGRGV